MRGKAPMGILAAGEIPKRAGQISVARDKLQARAPDPDTSLALAALLRRPEVGTFSWWLPQGGARG